METRKSSRKRRRRRTYDKQMMMRRRKKLLGHLADLMILFIISVIITSVPASSLLLTSHCLPGNLSAGDRCSCSWRSGKFVADCSGQGLAEVPNNEHHDYLLAHAGDNQMQSLNRDIQLLNLASNNITQLGFEEFSSKKFRNLQKLYLNANQLTRINPAAFYKLTGLIELDLSENKMVRLSEEQVESDETKQNVRTTIRTNKTTTFFDSLSQLRILNLNSNQLTSLQKFTFVSLVQLRQLLLSRNRIKSIDRLAFHGLDMLNVLHLDGNMLTSLDGRTLAGLHGLHSLQLAGQTNKWLCDCRLRALAASLLLAPQSKGRPEANKLIGAEQRAANILQDEPQCFRASLRGRQEDAHSNQIGQDHQDEEATFWTNMTLDQFECPPELAEQLYSGVRQQSSEPNSRAAPIRLVKEYFEPTEAIELTCAIRLTDELDLELTQVEWLVQVANKSASLQSIWSSGRPHQQPIDHGKQRAAREEEEEEEQRKFTGKQVKHEPLTTNATGSHLDNYQAKRRLAIVDYVTRARQRDAGQQEPGGGGQLVRIVHLILEQTSKKSAGANGSGDEPAEFLCRITNSAGQLNVVQPVRVQASSPDARAASRKRKQQTKLSGLAKLSLVTSNNNAHNLKQSAKARIREELAREKATSSALFVPVHLIPSDLFVSGIPGSSDEFSEQLDEPVEPSNATLGGQQEAISLARSLNNNRANSLRQTTGFNQSTSRAIQTQTDLDKTHLRQANNLLDSAVRLVAKYTSERPNTSNSYELDDGDHQDDYLTSESDENRTNEAKKHGLTFRQMLGPLSQTGAGNLTLKARLGLIYGSVRTRYLDRWARWLSSDAPLLLGIAAGILGGCLLSSLFLLRLRCGRSGGARGRRVRDSSILANYEAKQTFKKPLEEQDDEHDQHHDEQNDDDEADDDDDEVDDEDYKNLEADDDESPSGGPKLSSPLAEKVQTSGGSSSSTTNGSQTRLIARIPSNLTRQQQLQKQKARFAGRNNLAGHEARQVRSPLSMESSDSAVYGLDRVACSDHRQQAPHIGRQFNSLSRTTARPSSGCQLIMLPVQGEQQTGCHLLEELSAGHLARNQLMGGPRPLCNSFSHHVLHPHVLDADVSGALPSTADFRPVSCVAQQVAASDESHHRLYPSVEYNYDIHRHQQQPLQPPQDQWFSVEEQTGIEDSQSSSLLLASCEVGGAGDAKVGHLVVAAPPKLRSLRHHGEFCLVPSAFAGPASKDQAELIYSSSSAGGGFALSDGSFVDETGNLWTPASGQYVQDQQQNQPTLPCSSSMTSPGLSNSTSSSLTATSNLNRHSRRPRALNPNLASHRDNTHNLLQRQRQQQQQQTFDRSKPIEPADEYTSQQRQFEDALKLLQVTTNNLSTIKRSK